MEQDEIEPDLTDIPEDDFAEPEDAEVEHLAGEDEVEAEELT